MEDIYEQLKRYFENTPRDILEKGWKEIEYLNEIGPDVFEYFDYIRRRFGIEGGLPAYTIEPLHEQNNISCDVGNEYYLAA